MSTPQYHRGNPEKVRSALTALLQRDNDDSFVIFEEKRSKKFVQFAKTPEEGLLLDLPSQTLDAAERERAAEYFRRMGLATGDGTLTDRPQRRAAGHHQTFQKGFGEDIDAATRTTLELFERVYHFPHEFEMSITEN